MSENVRNFINSVKQQDYTTAKNEFQASIAERVNSAFENKKIELAKNMTEGTQINEASYKVPWDKDFNKDTRKWERKYNIEIKADRDFNEADVSGKEADIKRFLSKELDFEKPEFEMIGLDEGIQINEARYTVPWDKDFNRNTKKWEKKYNVEIKADRDFNQADVSGKDSDIKKFLSKELDFEKSEFEMIGLD